MKITYQNNSTIRLDKFLVEQLPNISRSQIQKAIKNGKVLVNGKKTSSHHFLKKEDEINVWSIFTNVQTKIKISTEKELSSKALELNSFSHPQPNKNIKLNIVAETDDYLIINKPAGLLVHPTDKNETDTLVNGLLAYYPKIKKVHDTGNRIRRGEFDFKQSLRPGIVHRLDRNVSGVMVVAKTQSMFEHLKKQFQKKIIKKEYIALVHGTMENSSGIIDFPIGMNKKTGKMAARPKTKLKTEFNSEASESNSVLRRLQSKPAITDYEVVKQFQHYALLKIQIKTGRTHQIRVHLNAIGHPVVGDQIYKPRLLKSRVKLDRIFLHAQTLGFKDIEGNKQEFTCPPSDKLNQFLDKLKR